MSDHFGALWMNGLKFKFDQLKTLITTVSEIFWNDQNNYFEWHLLVITSLQLIIEKLVYSYFFHEYLKLIFFYFPGYYGRFQHCRLSVMKDFHTQFSYRVNLEKLLSIIVGVKPLKSFQSTNSHWLITGMNFF